MISLKLCRNSLIRLLVALALISSLMAPPVYCQESEDSQIFISGFNSYQQKDYPGAIEKMNEVLQKYPDTPLRDMAIFWLARAYYKTGNQQEAARYMSQFSREYPDNPLRGTVEDDLLALTTRFEKGEKLPAAAAAQKPSASQVAAQKAKVEKERLAREQAEKERLAKEQAEKERLATQKAEQERIAAAKAEDERITAAAKAEAARLAALRAEEERSASQKIEQERAAAVAAEATRQAAMKQEQERVAAEQQRLAQEKIDLAKREAEQKLAGIKAEEERKTAEKAELERLAKLKNAQERLAAEKAEQARLATEAAEKERLARARQEQERAAREKTEQQRLAQLKAEQERLAAEKVEKERLAAAAAEKAQLAKAKQVQERMAAEQAAAQAEEARLAASRKEQERVNAEQAAVKAEEQRLARQREEAEKTRSAKAALREKAIEQYKSTIEKYPDTTAAASAAAKLKELGVAVALPPKTAALPAKSAEQQGSSQVLRFEVGQYAGFEFNLLTYPSALEVAKRVSVPFEVVNRGNGNDSFSLESGFPAEFNASFAAASTPDKAITQTPSLAPGETFKGVLSLNIPASSIDGLRISHPLKASSRFMSEASQSRAVNLVAAAPLLRAVLKTDNIQPLPGDKVSYRIVLLNVGSTAGDNITMRLSVPPQLEPVDAAAAGLRADGRNLVLDNLRLNSGESRELTVTFQLKNDSLAGQELLCHADLVNNPLKTTTSFVSNVARVKQTRGIRVKAASEQIVAIPGQTVLVPFIVTNTGNSREKFRIAPTVRGAQSTTVFHDLNRDGIKQANEPAITEIGPLEPQEEAAILVEVATDRNTADKSQGDIQVALNQDGDTANAATGTTRLTYSRPVLQMVVAGRNGRLIPGEVAAFDLTVTNQGSNLAKVVELQSVWPEQLELIAADPVNTSAAAGNINWKFRELGAGEKRTIKVSFRVKQGTGLGTSIQVTNTLKYEDQLGNRY